MSEPDPFAGGEKRPSLSFKDAKIGTSYTGTVIEGPKEVQSRDFETGQPAFWDKEGTQPKKSVVIGLLVDGEERSLWAQKPSAMFTALKEAKGKNQIEVGGTLAVKFSGETPNAKNPKLDAQKLYVAKYTPPVEADPFTADEPDF